MADEQNTYTGNNENGENDVRLRFEGFARMREKTRKSDHSRRLLEERIVERTKKMEKTMDLLKEEIAHRKQVEKNLEIAKEEITKSYEKEKELNQLHRRFIDMISHEYRTPLTVILTVTYILEQFEMEQKDEHSMRLGQIRRSVRTMVKMLEDVMLAHKIEGEDYRARQDKIELVDFIGDIVSEIGPADEAGPVFEFHTDRGKYYIHTDHELLKNVLMNIIINAKNYSPVESTVDVVIRQKEEKIELEIIDRGAGIPQEEQNYIFEPFYRGKNIEKIPGIGVGLWIAKKCAERIGAELFVSSEPEGGTRAVVHLPVEN